MGVPRGANSRRSPHYGVLQDLVDSLFLEQKTVRRLDVILAAESSELPEDLQEIVSLLPPGTFTRRRLCEQLNSSINGHAWGQVYGTVM